MAMSNAYWNATKPNGMPDSVWQAQQAAKKAEEEAKKAEETAKKLAEDTAKKKAEEAKKTATAALNGAPVSTEALVDALLNSSGTASTLEKYLAVQNVNAPTSSSSKVNGTSTNDARAEQLAIKNNTTPEYAQKEVGNSGLTTENARKEHISIMNNPTINPITDSQISAGAVTPSTNSGSGSTSTPLSGASSVVSTPTATPILSAEGLANYVSTVVAAAKNQLGGAVDPKDFLIDTKDLKPGTVELRSLKDLAEAYDITYDYDTLFGKFSDSVEAQYDAIYAKQRQNEDKYYDNAAAAQNTLLDTLSRDRSNAVQAGVSKGMQAANALGAMLGVSQQFANNATTLSQERSNTAKDYGADLAKAAVDAEATSNERKNAIMEIAKMLYGYDSEQYVANMDNYNTVLTNNAALQQTYMNNQTSLQNALASIFGNVSSNSLAATAQKYAADQTLAGNQAIANANRDAATLDKEVREYIAGLQYGVLEDNEVKQEETDTKADAQTDPTKKSTVRNQYYDGSRRALVTEYMDGSVHYTYY